VTATADTVPSAAASPRSEAPRLFVLVLIFWGAFAVPVAALSFLDPAMFLGQDPDNLMRLANVRDLVGGQGWFDLVQHRMDPPQGSLIHWSRLIDAPIAALVLIGSAFGLGEALALTAWPLLLLLGFMTGAALVAAAIGGRVAAVPALALSLFFLDPLLLYLPNDIDHHNAQHTLLILAVAAVLRLPSAPRLGIASGSACAAMLAIGLEMLPNVAVLAGAVALRWASGGDTARGTAWFGASFATLAALLYLGTASPEARFACDSLSLSFLAPFGAAGFGLAVLALFFDRAGFAALRLTALAALAGSVATMFALAAPECLGGPYGSVSPELKALWLDTVMEAQPLPVYFLREPVGAFATVGPPLVALVVALRHVRRNAWLWGVPLALLLTALALSLYQVRTIPHANAIAIPILAAWIAGVAQRHGVTGLWPLRRAAPVIGAFALAFPLAHLAVGWAGVEALRLPSFGTIAPQVSVEVPVEAVRGLSAAERDCLDPASAALLRQVPRGLVLSPVFYGPSVLVISAHDVLAGPYHRSGDAILDTIHAMRLPAEAARHILERRGVDYVAICSTAKEPAVTVHKAPDGLVAALLNGETPGWLAPVLPESATKLRLWRVLPEPTGLSAWPDCATEGYAAHLCDLASFCRHGCGERPEPAGQGTLWRRRSAGGAGAGANRLLQPRMHGRRRHAAA
jgi:hypothetical protein